MTVVDIQDLEQLRFSILPVEFFSPSALEVAPSLLGKLLVRQVDGHYLGGIITECEAYQGEEDQGCHAKAGYTPRTRVMFGPGGRAYVYFTYGMHWMLNAVTCPNGEPAAVLIRSIIPVLGIPQIESYRPKKSVKSNRGWLDGPAKLCQGLNITGSMNDIDLCATDSALFIAETGIQIPPDLIRRTHRIGLNSVPEPWKSKPWRWVADSQWHPKFD